jgi:NitT/TauT family transport system substrate-binding protein
MNLSMMRRRDLLGVCGAAATASALPAVAAEPHPMLLTTEFTPHGFHAPFYLAQQKGWFKDAGIELTIHDGKGTANTVNLVGAGQTDVGFSSLAAVAIASGKGVPVKGIASILHRDTYGLILRKGSGLSNPADFRDKEILYNTSSIEASVFSGFLAEAGMTLDDVKMLGVDSSAKVSSVLSGKGDAAIGPVPYYLALLTGKSEIDTIPFADHGVKILDFGLLASDSAITANAAPLKAFVSVVSRAYQYTLDGHLDEAIDALMTLRSDARLDHALSVAMFKEHAKFIPSPSSTGKPVGYISVEDCNDTVATLKRIKLLPDEARPENMYALALSPT